MGELPLSNIRVLDLTRVIAGPWATQLLGDLGADVIKIERPGTGDDSRRMGPPFLKAAEGGQQESGFFLGFNRNKKSVTVDLAQGVGQDLIRRLAAVSDVFVENYKVGDMARFGLGYERLRALNPRLVYCSITGFGQTGPYAARAAYDAILQAMGGAMTVNGLPDGVPGGGPLKMGPSVIDTFTGFYAALAIVSALFHRGQESGEGQYIDLALFDAVLAALPKEVNGYLVSGEAPGRFGNEGATAHPGGVLPCKDGLVMYATGTQRQFEGVCGALGVPEIVIDPRFVTNPLRVKNRIALSALLEDAARPLARADVLARFEAAQVPAGPVNSFAEAFADPQVRHRDMLVNTPHPLSDRLQGVVSPIRYSATPIEDYRAAPLLGQHTDEILSQLLGLDAAALGNLRSNKVI